MAGLTLPLATGALLLAFLQGCALAPKPQPQPQPQPLSLQEITLTAEPNFRFQAQRGVLPVRESAGKPASRTIDLVFHRLPSEPKATNRRTIVFIEGGPGVSANEQFSQRAWLWNVLRQHGDVLWIDQRGAGASQPQMHCAERWSHPLAASLPRAAMVQQAREKFKSCAATLRAQGADLGAYHTQAYADDIIAVTAALGIGQFDILAYSYGTQIGLDLMRRYPERLGRAVLAGVMGPDDSIRLATDHDAVLQAVDALQSVSLMPRIRELAALLDAKPLQLAALPSTPTAAVDGFLFRRSLATWLNSPAAAQQVPAFLQQVEQAITAAPAATPPLLQTVVNATVAERGGLLNRRAAAQHFLTVCASGQSVVRQQQTAEAAKASLLGYALHSYLPDACDGWGIQPLPEGFRAATPLATPTLLIAATWDMRTPYAQALRQRSRLTTSQLLTLEHGGHSDLLRGHAVVQQALQAWFEGEKPVKKADFQHQISP